MIIYFSKGSASSPAPKRSADVNGVLILDDSDLRLLGPDETVKELELKQQDIRFTSKLVVPIRLPPDTVTEKIIIAIRQKTKIKVSITNMAGRC